MNEVKLQDSADALQAPHSQRGLIFTRRFTTEGVSPYDEVEWEKRTASITDSKGNIIFEQKDVEVPVNWSMTATNIVASKYLHGKLGTPQRETGVRQLVSRVAETICDWGQSEGYFATPEDAAIFHDELTHMLLNQKVAFNSPVWCNVGCDRLEPDAKGENWHWDSATGGVQCGATGYKNPQCSACFINSVEDSMAGIMDLARTEALLFKFGSGTGTNFSSLRSSHESVSGGGTASGPLSFMRGFDAFAGVIKSGGKTRRAAKMAILNVEHPDILDFIDCKSKEEAKAYALVREGYDGSGPDSEAYSSIFFQNANNSVRVSDEFMQANEDDGDFTTYTVKDHKPVKTYKAREIMHKISDAAWLCGDPGMQFDDTINKWHTCKNSARINASNPCVTGNSLVATSDGWQRIDALTGKQANVYGADGQPHFVTSIFPTGTKPVYRLRTHAGFELRLTADHKVLTANRGDVPASELREGDTLTLQGAGFGRRSLTERLALAVGLAVGDGCLSRSETTGNLQEIITLVMAAEEAGVLEKVAGEVNEQKLALKATGSVGRNDAVSVSVRFADVSRLSFSSQPVVSLFKEYAVLDQGSAEKQFTPAIYELDKPSQAAVLRGLFTADGTVANYGDKSQYVSLDSTSEALLGQVQLLLLSFGIKSKLYRERRGGATHAILPDGHGGRKLYPVREMNSLRISRTSRVYFEREIGFDSESLKAQALAELNADFAAYRDQMTDDFESLELLGEEPVYDLTESATNHFTANGLVVHNCSEYMFLDNSACNLASLNLMKYITPSGGFDIASYRHSISVIITAMEILVDNSGYPTEAIARNSHDYRPLGLGFANLGALLMAFGLPYDSAAGRDLAGSLTAILTGQAYLQSAIVAANCPPIASATPLTASTGGQGGACPGFYVNREPFLDVIRMHRAEVNNIGASRQSGEPFDVPQLDALLEASREAWDMALLYGERHGYRNSQVSVLAPTGTIGFMMDCDTTGIEPDLALVKFKKLVGGGMIKIVNNTVPAALFKLGYSDDDVNAIVSYIDATGTIEGAPAIKPEHLSVFDCSFKPAKGTRSIHYMGHVKMMAAAQPFLSGAISKTVNLPHEATVEDVAEVYAESWREGIKAVAIYRDGSKGTQPLNVSMDAKREPSALETVGRRVLAQLDAGQPAAEADVKALEAKPGEMLEVTAKSVALAASSFQRALAEIAKLAATPAAAAIEAATIEAQNLNGPPRAVRHRLPDERASVTHKFAIAGHEGYITVGLYPTGQPGELFIKMAKEGSTISGLMDSFATSISIALQHGVPLKVLCEKFAHTRFEPSGWTGNQQIGYAKSLMDYIFRWLHLRFLEGEQLALFAGLAPQNAQLPEPPSLDPETDGGSLSQNHLAQLAEEVARRLHQVSGPTSAYGANANGSEVAIEAQADSVSEASAENRSLFHATEAMSEMYEMGDAPSCSVCGAIMTRNGSCYRCMECGSTSGCS